jgi:hypothetical protein
MTGPYQEPYAPSGHLACPKCHGGEFWLRPDGRIQCAGDDCYADPGYRWVPSAGVIAAPADSLGSR